MRRAIVDIGTTACRLVVAEATGDGCLRACDDREVVLGLARAVRRDGRFGEGLLQLTAETLRRLRASAARAGAEGMAATLAERLFAARDGRHLHHRAEEALQVPVRVVDAVDDVRAATRAVRHRLGLPWAPGFVEFADHHLRVARPGPDGPLRVIEIPAGVRDLLPAGAGDLLRPAAYTRARERLRDRVAPIAELAPVAPLGGVAVQWPVLTGAPAVALGWAVAGRPRIGGPSIDGLRLSLATLADLEHDLFAAHGGRRRPGTDPAAVAEVAGSVLTLRVVLERLEAPGVLVSAAGPTEGRLWTELEVGSDPTTDPFSGPVAVSAGAGRGSPRSRTAGTKV